MILTFSNIQAAMNGDRIGTMDDKSVKTSSEALLRDLYILAGKEPPLYYDQLDDLATDIKASFKYLTFEELKLAGKAGIAGELGDLRLPSYAAIMRWTEAYVRSSQLADARKIIANRPVEAPRLTDEQGLAIMQKTMPEAARRRWEDIRTQGKFGLATIPHVSAQIYDWLGEEGILRLDPADRRAAVAKAKAEAAPTNAASGLESGQALFQSTAKHYALQTWMQLRNNAGLPLTLPAQVRRIYQ